MTISIDAGDGGLVHPASASLWSFQSHLHATGHKLFLWGLRAELVAQAVHFFNRIERKRNQAESHGPRLVPCAADPYGWHQLLATGWIAVETKSHFNFLLKEELVQGFQTAAFARLDFGGEYCSAPGNHIVHLRIVRLFPWFRRAERGC